MTMYLEHFGLIEAPFKITPHTEFFFAGANRGETLDALLYAITSGEGIVKVTGEVGAGKTMLCRVLMERLPETVETIYLAVPSLSRDEMLATIAGDLGLDPQGLSTTKLIRGLQEKLIAVHAEGKQVVALVDEAHAMPLETLEEIRLLSNLETSHFKLMQIVLFGQPELDEHLLLPNMRQLKERITHSFNLLPLPPRDIKDYVNFRLRAAGYKGPDLFGKDALKLIAEASEGLTRRINIYCDKTLLAAFADDTHSVTADHVRAAIADTQIVMPQHNTKRVTLWFAVSAALVVGLVSGFFAGRLTAPQNIASIAAISPKATPGGANQPITPTNGAIGTLVTTADTTTTTTNITPVTTVPNGVPIAAPAASTAAPSTPTTAPTANPPPNPTAPLAPQTDATQITVRAPQSNIVAPIKQDVTPVVDAKTATAPLIARPDIKPETNQDWLEKRMAADVARIAKLPGSRFAIQLMSADERERGAIEAFLRAAARELSAERIMVYPAGTAENPRVSVLYGNYAERVEASAELSGLPVKVTQFRPYVRSFQAIRDDLRLAQ